VIQSIEKFGSELQCDTFVDRSVLDHGKIHGLKTGAAERSSAEIAPGSDGWQRKRGRIKPLRLFFQKYGASERRIQVRPVRVPRVPIARAVSANLGGEGKPAQ